MSRCDGRVLTTQPDSVWSYDFVHDRLANGDALKLLCVLDEHTRECLAIEVGKIRLPEPED